ncbi:MAG: 6-phosphogluconolactonase [Pseudomonadales bacterium]
MLNPVTLPELAQRFERHDVLAQALALDIAGRLNAAIDARGSASVAFSGGSTPRLLFAELALQDIDWANVQVTLVDDRCVPAGHERSNAGMLQRTLFATLDKRRQPTFYPLFVEGESLENCNRRLAALALPFDCLVLGMGDDAHTASFFPDAENLAGMLDLADERLLGETRSAASIERRLTFRLPVVLRSRNVILHICGDGKWNVLQKACGALADAHNTANANGNASDEDDAGLSELDFKYPILSVLRRSALNRAGGTPVAIYHATEC